MEALEAALKSGFRPKRTFYISFGHDEEVPHLLSSSLVLSFPTQLERSQCSRDNDVLYVYSHVVCVPLVQVFGRMGAMQVAALLEARGVRRLQYVLEEGMVIVERVLPGLSRPVAMCARKPTMWPRHSLASPSPAPPDTRTIATYRYIHSSCPVLSCFVLSRAHRSLAECSHSRTVLGISTHT